MSPGPRLLLPFDRLRLSFRTLTMSRNQFHPCLIVHFLLYRLLPVASLSLYSLFYLYQRFSALYSGETCFIDQPTVPEFAVKIKDCSVCSNVSENTVIEKISPMEFMVKHAYSFVPLIMKGAALDWPAMNVLTVDYFKDLYNNNPNSLENDVNEGQFFAYSSGIMDINELMTVLNEKDSSKHPKWYIGWYVTTCCYIDYLFIITVSIVVR